MEFKSVLADEDISLYYIYLGLDLPKGTDVNTSCLATIDWVVSIEAKKDRIKNISASILNVSLQIEYWYLIDADDESKGIIEGIKYITSLDDYKIDDSEFKILNEQLSICDLDVDFKTKTFKIT